MAVTNFETELGRSVPFHRKRPSSRGLWIQRRWSWPVLAQSLSSLQSLCMCIKANPPSCCIWISHLQSTISTIDYIPQVSLRMSTFSAHGHALALSPTWQTWILSGSQRDPNRLCSWPFLEKEKGWFIMVYSKIQTTFKGTKFGKGADTNKWKIFTWIRTEQLGKVLQKVLPTHAEDARIIAMDSPVQFRIPPHILPVTNITRYDKIWQHCDHTFTRFICVLCFIFANSFANSFQGRKGCQGCSGFQQPHAPNLPLVQSHHTRHFGPKGSAISPASAICERVKLANVGGIRIHRIHRIHRILYSCFSGWRLAGKRWCTDGS